MRQPVLPLNRLFAILLLTVCAATQAEQDYAFGHRLLEQAAAQPGNVELVKRLAERLLSRPETRAEGLLLQAELLQYGAAAKRAPERLELLRQAEGCCRQLLEPGAKTRLGSEAAQLNESLARDLSRCLFQLANDKETPAAKAAAFRGEALALLERSLSVAKAASEAAKPAFAVAYAKLQEWEGQTIGMEPAPQVPKAILEPLEKSFDAWIRAERRFLAVRLDQLDSLGEGDAGRRAIAAEVVGLCQSRTAEDSPVARFPLLVAWYHLTAGHAHAATGEASKATAAWQEALAVELLDPTPAQQAQVRALKHTILYDLVKLWNRQKASLKVVETIEEALQNPEFRALFENEAPGMDLLLDYAGAMVSREDTESADLERAIRVLHQAIDRETRKAGTRAPSVGRLSTAMAGLLRRAQERDLTLQLSPQAWYWGARGFFLLAREAMARFAPGGQATAPPGIRADLRQASEAYRRAIRSARAAGGTALTRLQYEPQAYEELALAYLQQEECLEAILAYDAILEGFLPQRRAAWLPNPTDAAQPWAEIRKACLELDRDEDGLLARVRSGQRRALQRYLSAPPPSSWKIELPARLAGTGAGGAPGGADLEYLTASLALESARALEQGARSAPAGQEVAIQLGTAGAEYLKAAECFAKVKEGAPHYESALFQTAACYAAAAELWSTGRRPPQAEGREGREVREVREERLRDLATRALAAFDRYRQWAAGHPAAEPQLAARRQAQEGQGLLSSGALQLSLRNWEEALRQADGFLAWEAKAAPEKRRAGLALLQKFQALLGLAASQPPQGCAPLLARAEETLEALDTFHAKDARLRASLLNTLARHYTRVAEQAEAGNLDRQQIDRYEARAAALLAESVTLSEGDSADRLALPAYTRVLARLNRTAQHQAAADWGARILAKFDPQDRFGRLPDDPASWQLLLKKMLRVIDYRDRTGGLSTWERCKQDHTVLIDYLYETEEGRAKGDSAKRPAEDRYPIDLVKAQAQAAAIRRAYPDCQTLDPRHGPDGQAWLERIEEEIDFRRKIEATRDLVVELALKVAADLERQNRTAEAKKYREMANRQLKRLLEYRGDTPVLRIKTAELDLATGRPEEALQTLREVQAQLPPNSVPYFTASRRAAECLARLGRWAQAAEFPEFVALTAGLEAPLVQTEWPGLRDFLRECYRNGAPQPEALHKLLASNPAPKP